MEIEEYRKNSKILGREYHKLVPPFLPINFGYEEITNSNSNNMTGIINPKNDLVIKRNKPINNTASKYIENYMMD